MSKYKYLFQIDGIDVYPVWESDTKLAYEKDDDNVFARVRLDGKFILQHGKRSDFNRVWAQPLDHEFTFLAQYIVDGVVEDEITGTFYKTNVEYDIDTKTATVTVDTVDRYDKLLRAFDKEFDLIKDLAPTPFKLNYVKEPLVQVVFPYHDAIWNKCGHSTWILSLGTTYTSSQLNAFGFIDQENPVVYIPGSSDMTPDVSGIYEQTDVTQYTRLDGAYRLSRVEITRWTIVDIAMANTVFRGPNDSVPGNGDILSASPFGNEVVLTSLVDPNSQCKPFGVWYHQRILTDQETVGGIATLPLPSDDIGGLVFNYANYMDMSSFVSLPILLTPGDTHTTSERRYGKFAAESLHFPGEYFDPSFISLPGFTSGYAVMSENWTQYHLVARIVTTLMDDIDDAATSDSIDHAYKLADVINALFDKIDDTISFDPSPAGSMFLYSANNPLTGDMQDYVHFIVPKSNILIKNYTEAATKEPIQFRWIDELLKNGIRNYWWINNNQFLFEHEEYFRRGLSYNVDNIGADLTTQTEPQTGKKWSYATNKYKYLKEKMPERIVYRWMDDVPDLFDGEPIDILSVFVEKGTTRDRSISRFSSDLSYAQAFSDNFSKDGYIVVCARLVGDEYEVVFTDVPDPVFTTVNAQNGYWAFRYLHDKFHRHNLPAPDVKINGETTTALSVERGRQQDIVYPANVNPNVMRLIKTSVGNGIIQKIYITLNSRKAEITVLHDLDFDNPCPTC